MMKISAYSTPEAIQNFAEAEAMRLTEVRRAQVYQLYHVACEPRKVIAEITGYAVSTLSSIRKMVCDYADLAEAIFDDSTAGSVEIVEVEETVIIEPVAHTKIRRCGDSEIPMMYLEDCGLDIPRTQQAYLFKFYSDDNEIPVFSKIGTTSVSINERLRREIGDYIKTGFDIKYVEVCKIYQCGNVPAEAFESYLRAMLILKYPNTWRKNDRFFGVDVSTPLFIELCNAYQNLM